MRQRSVITALLAVMLALSATAALAGSMVPSTAATGTDDVAIVAATAAGSTPNYFCGFSSLETIGSSSATVSIYAGTSTSGRLLFSYSLSAGESRSEGPWALDHCLPASEGVFVARGGSGSVLVTVYTRTGL